MAERYIFNKSLNRRAPRCYWLAFAVAAIFSFTVFVSPVKAQEPLLVDPDAKRNASTVPPRLLTSTLPKQIRIRL